MTEQLKTFLDQKAALYNRPLFIDSDPVSVPHQFTRKQDIEIAALFAAVFSWGNRTTIIRKAMELMDRMDRRPYEFCVQADTRAWRRLEGFVHRTFCADDLFYFMEFLRRHYSEHESLESAFSEFISTGDPDTGPALIGFRRYFFSGEHLKRTEKHISSPLQKSTCKRLNMFLRWMVRKDENGVDFGLWQAIRSEQLICPVDLHVARVARKLGLLKRKPLDWEAALELTLHLRLMDPADPVRYDFALFGLGIIEKY